MTASILDIAGKPKASRAREASPALELARKVGFINTQKLPAVLRADSVKCDLTSLLTQHRGELQPLLRKYGALLLRGFNIADAAEFNRVAALYFAGEGAEHNAPQEQRRPAHPGLLALQPSPRPTETVLQHNELADIAGHPQDLLLFCEAPATRGGETTLADTRAIYAHIDTDIRSEFERRGVQYQRHLAGEPQHVTSALRIPQRLGRLPRTWQAVFGTDSRAGVEAACQAHALTVEWQEADGSAAIRNRLPATLLHPVTRERLWFNRVLQAGRCAASWAELARHPLAAAAPGKRRPLQVLFGDGTRIPSRHFKHLADVHRSLTTTVPLQPGDLLLLDNLLTSHGRRPYRGPRKLLMAMG